MRKFLFFPAVVACFAIHHLCTGQESLVPFSEKGRKGSFFIAWGYNRSQFSDSDIRFRGKGYDFTLHDIRAVDRPSPFEAKVYFNPSKWSIPQFNIRAGYFINDHLVLSAGYDHMKYVMVNGQQVTISGVIDSTASETWSGNYTGESIVLNPDFLMYEHTNGCNYISAELDVHYFPWQSKNRKHRFGIFGGWGIGLMVPRSDVWLFSERGANLFHLAGYGTAVSAGMRFEIYHRFFLQFAAKGGFIHLPDVLTFKASGHKASQHFFFLEEIFSGGVNFRLFQGRDNHRNEPL